MAKPWGRYEIDFIDHPKFRALHANAFVLWWEVKNYCDKFHTDGRFPRDLVNTFRHNSQKAMTQLLTSCGVKPNGEAYAPLWEPQDIGGVAYLTMHDYLDHNDCRDEVLARLQDAEDAAEIRRVANKERQKRFRAERKEKLVTLRNALRNAGGHASERVTCPTPTETQTQTVLEKRKEREKSASLSPPADDPFLNATTTDRAGAFVRRYEALYPQHRNGARYAVKPARDYAAAVTLCTTWADDGHLDKLAVVFLTTDHKFAEEGSRTIPQFLALASWCDSRLREWAAKHQVAV